MPKPNDCLARQYSDQMVCHKCGLVWDMNDPEPPECLREVNASIVAPATQPTVDHATGNEGAPA